MNVIKLDKLKKQICQILFSVFRIFFFLTIAYVIILPFFSMVSYALRPVEQYYDTSVVWVPKSITWDNIKQAFDQLDYLTGLKNTVLIEVVSALITTCMCSLTAYGFSRFEFKFKKVLNFILLLTIFIPTPMIIVSLYENFSNFDVLGIISLINKITGSDIRVNLLNTAWTFYLPSLFSMGLRSGLCIFIYMQLFKSLPKELEEAAAVDGAGPLRTFFNIIVPSSSVAFVTVAVLSIIWHWNDYYLCVMYFNKDYPLTVSLKTVLESTKTNAVLLQMSSCLLFIAPLMVFYAIIQRRFIQSIDRVGITG